MNYVETVKKLTDDAFKQMTLKLEQELFYGQYFDISYNHEFCIRVLSLIKYNNAKTIIEYR